MNGYGYRNSKGGRFKRLALILLLPFILLVLSYAAYRLFLIPPPEVKGIEDFSLLSAEKTVTLQGKNIESIEVFLSQDMKSIELLKDEPRRSETLYTLRIRPRSLGLRDGAAVVTVLARSGILKKLELKVDVMIDTVPPKLSVLDAPSVLYQGMGTVALLRAEGASSVSVRIDDGEAFRAYRNRRGPENTYVVFFPVPFDTGEKAVFYAVARDRAGNETIRTLSSKVKRKSFKKSSITIGDGFINRVVYPLLNRSDISDPVSAFVKVNEEWRERDVRRLAEIGRESEPEMLWKGAFLQLRNSKVMAGYGDRRVYLYKGRAISRSTHLGYDLASVSKARVGAANSGIVKFAGDLGIYGNAVIIDHGLGLMSLYGHLSEITVEEGQRVKKGETIGRTGSSGLAGGDHLHFGILVQGVEVSPLYWWDKRWIKANIESIVPSAG